MVTCTWSFPVLEEENVECMCCAQWKEVGNSLLTDVFVSLQQLKEFLQVLPVPSGLDGIILNLIQVGLCQAISKCTMPLLGAFSTFKSAQV